MTSVCAVIPVYDHEHAVGRMVESLRQQGLTVFLVDDGSGPPVPRSSIGWRTGTWTRTCDAAPAEEQGRADVMPDWRPPRRPGSACVEIDETASTTR